MKRIIVIVFAILPLFLYAGVIMKHSGERLEDVVIKSVTETEIVYELDGTESTLPKSDVSAILYDDGRYEEIKVQKPTLTQSENEQVVIKYLSDDTQTKQLAEEKRAQEAAARTAAIEQARLEAEQARLQKEQAVLEKQREEAEAKRLAQEQKRKEAEEKKLAQEAAKAAAMEKARLEKEQEQLEKERAEQEYKERSKYFVTKVSDFEYICNGTSMNKKAYQNFLRNNCPQAYAMYRRGTREVAAGWSLFAVGIAMNVGWAILAAPEAFPFGMSRDDMEVLGIVLGSLGAGIAVGVGIPTLGAGYAHRNKSCKIYNESCAGPQESAVTLNFRFTGNGLGLALNF